MSSLLSIGIDVGTSTTQVVFSRLQLRDKAPRYAAPDIQITAAEVIYRGDVHETPLLDNARIDSKALRNLAEEEFRLAGILPGETDTGAVIITGESARKENAAAVLEQLSAFAGDFVVATAGPDLESRIAGQGSGAQEESRRRRCRVANFDIGGGTTNIAVFDCGALAAVGCYDIGGRLLRFTPEGALTYISPSAEHLAQITGLRFQIHKKPTEEDLQSLAHAMAAVLEGAIAPGEEANLPVAPANAMQTVGSSCLHLDKPVDAICFSGGVADCICNAAYHPFEFGDFGVMLGEAVRQSGLYGYPVITPKETIRATVVGAGSYTTTLSGSTVRYTDEALFPMKNLSVFALDPAHEEAAFAGKACDISQQLRWFMQQADLTRAAVALEGKPSPGWQELKRLAEALANAFHGATGSGTPILLLARHDMGKALGQAILPYALGRPVIALDGISVKEHQFIDIGRPVMHGYAVPVVIKTLVFGSSNGMEV